jgi:hypothetical protein
VPKSEWIDYRAGDWDTARARTRRSNWRSRTYALAGDYAIVVKVIDILGNDTTKTVNVT